MRFELKEFATEPQEKINKTFLSVPKTETQVELVESSVPTETLVAKVAKGLFYLPAYIKSVIIHVKYSYKFHPADIDNHRSVDSHTAQIAPLGYILNLPKSVKNFTINFLEALSHDNQQRKSLSSINSSTIQDDLKRTYGLITNSISLVKLIGRPKPYLTADEYVKTLKSVPLTAKGLCIEQINLANLNHNRSFLKELSHLRHLSLAYTNLGAWDELLNFSKSFPLHLESLDLGFNNLDVKSTNDLAQLLINLFLLEKLTFLSLAGNHLSAKGCDKLKFILAHISKFQLLSHLDLSDNGLLLMSDKELTAILKTCASLTSLRLCETNTSIMPIEALILRFETCIPPNITSISFANCNLLGRSMDEFAKLISHLPFSIKEIDFSDNNLAQRSKEELIKLFSSIPAHIKKIKLNRNGFCALGITTLHDVLATLPKNIEIDLSDNGFEDLQCTYANDLLDALPDTIFNFSKSLMLKRNGILVPYSTAFKTSGLFKAPARLIHQKENANLMHTLVNLMRHNGLNFNILERILTFISESTAQAISRMARHLPSLPNVLPDNLSSQQVCEDFVTYRKKMLKPKDRILNLSRCALNRLSHEGLKKVFALPDLPGVNSLILKSNGFLLSERAKKNFVNSLPHLSPKITYLDLSDNGFEDLPAKELMDILKKLPKNVRYISFANERPLAPKVQIAKRKFPEYFHNLTKNDPDPLRKADILLRNYSMDSSAAKRFFTLKWNRHNIEYTEKLDAQIESGIIRNVADLIANIEATGLPNEAGTLGQSAMFLATPKVW